MATTMGVTGVAVAVLAGLVPLNLFVFSLHLFFLVFAYLLIFLV